MSEAVGVNQDEQILGKSIFPIVFGTARFGTRGEADPSRPGFFLPTDEGQSEEIRLLRTAAGLGYDFYDTALSYGNSEVRLAQALKLLNTKNLLVATKVGINYQKAEDLRRDIHTSVGRLGIIPDVIYIHNRWEGHMDEAMDSALDELAWAVETHYTHGVGISNFQPDELRHAISYLAEQGQPVAMYQARLNLYNPRPDAPELLEICEENRIPFIASSSLAKGELLHRHDPALEAIAKKYGMSKAQLAIFAVRTLGAFPVVRTQNVEHMHENIRALSFQLDADDVEILKKILLSGHPAHKKDWLRIRHKFRGAPTPEADPADGFA